MRLAFLADRSPHHLKQHGSEKGEACKDFVQIVESLWSSSEQLCSTFSTMYEHASADGSALHVSSPCA
jgi:hypothetical protein